MNIVLIGLRGAGKTTVAKLLSKRLNYKLVETDQLIVQREKKSISEIVAKHGWDYFRQKEGEVIQAVSRQDNLIIDTGGGVVTQPANITALKKHGKLFLLRGTINTLVKRIGNDSNRPSLSGKQSVKEDMKHVLRERKQFYQDAADVIIDTDTKTAKQVAEVILQSLEQKI